MVTAICIMSGVCLLLIGVCAYLACALFLTNELLRQKERKNLDIPDPVVWDYTKEGGWVDGQS